MYFSCAQKHADQTIELLIGLPSTLSLFGLDPSLGVKPFCTIRLLKEPRQVESKIRKEPVFSNVLFYNVYTMFTYLFFYLQRWATPFWSLASQKSIECPRWTSLCCAMLPTRAAGVFDTKLLAFDWFGISTATEAHCKPVHQQYTKDHSNLVASNIPKFPTCIACWNVARLWASYSVWDSQSPDALL